MMAILYNKITMITINILNDIDDESTNEDGRNTNNSNSLVIAISYDNHHNVHYNGYRISFPDMNLFILSLKKKKKKTMAIFSTACAKFPRLFAIFHKGSDITSI